MNKSRTSLTPRGWVVVALAILWALALGFLSSGCDAPLDDLQLEAAVESPANAPADESCNPELHEIVEARFEQLDCLAECDAIMLECLDQAEPSCFHCEHPRAICASNCPGGAIVQ